MLKDYFVAEGYPALIGDPHDLEYNGDYSSVDGFRIDIVYKRESSFTNFLTGSVETIRWSMHIISRKALGIGGARCFCKNRYHRYEGVKLWTRY